MSEIKAYCPKCGKRLCITALYRCAFCRAWLFQNEETNNESDMRELQKEIRRET